MARNAHSLSRQPMRARRNNTDIVVSFIRVWRPAVKFPLLLFPYERLSPNSQCLARKQALSLTFTRAAALPPAFHACEPLPQQQLVPALVNLLPNFRTLLPKQRSRHNKGQAPLLVIPAALLTPSKRTSIPCQGTVESCQAVPQPAKNAPLSSLWCRPASPVQPPAHLRNRTLRVKTNMLNVRWTLSWCGVEDRGGRWPRIIRKCTTRRSANASEPNGRSYPKRRNGPSLTKRSGYDRCTWRSILTTSTALEGSRRTSSRRTNTRFPCRCFQVRNALCSFSFFDSWIFLHVSKVVFTISL